MNTIKNNDEPINMVTNPFGKEILGFMTTNTIVHQRTKRWYTIFFVLVGLGVLMGLWQQETSVVLISVMIGVVYWMRRDIPPVPLPVMITEMGIRYGNDFLQYAHTDCFWILWKPGEIAMLHLQKSKPDSSEIMIPIPESLVQKIRMILLEHITEEKNSSERARDFFLRILKL